MMDPQTEQGGASSNTRGAVSEVAWSVDGTLARPLSFMWGVSGDAGVAVASGTTPAARRCSGVMNFTANQRKM
jgi:hypothetical protein